ncbi:protein of unknown function DUF2460 [Erythrobacter phage vB_EliS-L02]|nr:protein of unknown function DUF2460 [Erythrobacter phage vB_EliS-L02]
MDIAQFHEVRFPEDISYGSSGGPGFKTNVFELASGHEQRNIEWSLAKAMYDVSYGIKEREQMEQVLDFFYARRGQAYGFRFKDWMDFQIPRQAIGTMGNDLNTSTLQVYKRYEPLTAYAYDRPILKIVTGTVSLWRNGTLLSAADTAARLNLNTGVITNKSNDDDGAAFEIECQFDVPVRFATDEIKIAHDDWELMSWPSIPLSELKPRSS